MVIRKRKYAKKGTFRKRRFRKSKYGRGGRSVRKIVRRALLNKIVVPRNKVAPDKCFIKVKTTQFQTFLSPADVVYMNCQLVGNGLDGIFATPGLADQRSDRKLAAYANLYNKYYVYASKVKVVWFQGYNNTNALAQIPLYLLIHPTTSSTPLTESTVGFDITSNQARPEMLPQTKVKYINCVGFGNGPYVMKHKMSTKNMYQKNTKTDNDFTGTMIPNLATDTLIVSNPAAAATWYWNIGAGRPDEDSVDIVESGQVNMTAVITIEHYVMLYQRNTYEDTIELT